MKPGQFIEGRLKSHINLKYRGLVLSVEDSTVRTRIKVLLSSTNLYMIAMSKLFPVVHLYKDHIDEEHDITLLVEP